MQIRFLSPINIFAQRISFQSTCVKIRTTFSGVLSVEHQQQETLKSDYYCEEFSIGRGRTTNTKTSSEISVSSDSQSLSSENPHRMPVVAAVVAHRRFYPAAASSLASSTAGSKRSSCAVRLSALSILAPTLVAGGLSGVSKKSSHSSSKFITGGGTFTSGVPVPGISGKGSCRPLVELKQLGHLLGTPAKGTAILAESRRYYAKGKDKPKSKKGVVVVNESEMGEVIDVDNFKKQLDKLFEQMKDDFTKQLSIRGAAGALESLQVEFEGESYPLQELAQVGRKNPQLAILNLASLPDAIKPVLKAIEDSGMNLNPQQEGTTIYVPLPKVTREHRETLAKNAKALFTKYKVAMQGVQNKYVKQCKGQKDLSEDLVFSVQNQIMKFTENYIIEAEKLTQLKQKELLENK